MVRSSHALLGLLSIVFCFGCSQPTGPSSAGLFRAWADPPQLVLSNDGDRPVYYHVIEQETATRTDLFACVDPDTCPSVPPGEETRIPYTSILGYERPGEVALVFWWYLVPDADGGFRPDSGWRVEQVRLR